MSYNPTRQALTELFSAWNSIAQTLPNKTSGSSESNLDTTLNLNSIGEGDIQIQSNSIINLGEIGLYAFYAADLRSTSAGNTSGDLYEIHFKSSDGDFSSAFQRNRINQNDDQCYSLYESAELKVGYALRCNGETLAPWVRVLGVLLEK